MGSPSYEVLTYFNPSMEIDFEIGGSYLLILSLKFCPDKSMGKILK